MNTKQTKLCLQWIEAEYLTVWYIPVLYHKKKKDLDHVEFSRLFQYISK